MKEKRGLLRILPLICFFILGIILTGCGTISTGSRIKEDGASMETVQKVLKIEKGYTRSQLKDMGISRNTPGIREVTFSEIPKEILGVEMSSEYEHLLTKETLSCIKQEKRCSALIIMRKSRDLENEAPLYLQLLGIRDEFNGQEEYARVILVMLDNKVVETHKNYPSHSPAREEETDWLAPIKGILPGISRLFSFL